MELLEEEKSLNTGLQFMKGPNKAISGQQQPYGLMARLYLQGTFYAYKLAFQGTDPYSSPFTICIEVELSPQLGRKCHYDM